MNYKNINLSIKKLAYMVGVASISLLLAVPVLAQTGTATGTTGNIGGTSSYG